MQHEAKLKSAIDDNVDKFKQMAIDGRDCPDILLQIAAIRKALDNTAKIIFDPSIRRIRRNSL
jgi:DNA-binding FrmR family transcriptional regulator